MDEQLIYWTIIICHPSSSSFNFHSCVALTFFNRHLVFSTHSNYLSLPRVTTLLTESSQIRFSNSSDDILSFRMTPHIRLTIIFSALSPDVTCLYLYYDKVYIKFMLLWRQWCDVCVECVISRPGLQAAAAA